MRPPFTERGGARLADGRRWPRLLLLLLAAAWWALRAEAAVDLLYFRAESRVADINLTWATGSESDNLGFFVRREQIVGEPEQAPRLSGLVPASGDVEGAVYNWVDSSAQPDTVYVYWLEDVDTNGLSTFHGPTQGIRGGGAPIQTATPLPPPATQPATPSQSATSVTTAPTATPPPTTAATSVPTIAPAATGAVPTSPTPTPPPTPRPAATTPPQNPPPTAAPDEIASPAPPTIALVTPTPTTINQSAVAVDAASTAAPSSPTLPPTSVARRIGADQAAPRAAPPAPALGTADTGLSRRLVTAGILAAGLLFSLAGGAATWHYQRRAS